MIPPYQETVELNMEFSVCMICRNITRCLCIDFDDGHDDCTSARVCLECIIDATKGETQCALKS